MEEPFGSPVQMLEFCDVTSFCFWLIIPPQADFDLLSAISVLKTTPTPKYYPT
jgi:hypothetical protein